MADERLSYTPAELAKLHRLSRTRLMHWINSGELRASNLGSRARPRYRITKEAMDAFLERRAVKPAVVRQAARRVVAIPPRREWF